VIPDTSSCRRPALLKDKIPDTQVRKACSGWIMFTGIRSDTLVLL
jgi:hypothetical protein